MSVNAPVNRIQEMVYPGHVAISRGQGLLCSVCGSGVIVVVWNRALRVGGMAHCLFVRKKQAPRTNFDAATAVDTLLWRLRASGGCEAQLFGGGGLSVHQVRRMRKVIEVVRRRLRRLNIALVSEDVGGSAGRKVLFDPGSGSALVLKTHRIRSSDWEPETLAESFGPPRGWRKL